MSNEITDKDKEEEPLALGSLELLTQLSMRGTVRLTVGAMNRQCQLTYWTESSKRDLRGTLQDILKEAVCELHNNKAMTP